MAEINTLDFVREYQRKDWAVKGAIGVGAAGALTGLAAGVMFVNDHFHANHDFRWGDFISPSEVDFEGNKTVSLLGFTAFTLGLGIPTALGASLGFLGKKIGYGLRKKVETLHAKKDSAFKQLLNDGLVTKLEESPGLWEDDGIRRLSMDHREALELAVVGDRINRGDKIGSTRFVDHLKLHDYIRTHINQTTIDNFTSSVEYWRNESGYDFMTEDGYLTQTGQNLQRRAIEIYSDKLSTLLTIGNILKAQRLEQEMWKKIPFPQDGEKPVFEVDPYLYGRVHRQIGDAALNVNRYETALEHFRLAEDSFGKKNVAKACVDAGNFRLAAEIWKDVGDNRSLQKYNLQIMKAQ